MVARCVNEKSKHPSKHKAQAGVAGPWKLFGKVLMKRDFASKACPFLSEEWLHHKG